MVLYLNSTAGSRNLNEAFEGVVDAAFELKFVSKDTKINFKDELAAIGVKVDRAFEDQYLDLDNELTTLYKLKKLGGVPI